MKKFDIHGIAGLAATVGSFTLANYNLLMGAIAATSTAGYMALRFFREYRKFRRDTVTTTTTTKTQHEDTK